MLRCARRTRNYLCKGNYGNDEYKDFLSKWNIYLQRKKDTVATNGSGVERTEAGRLRRIANIVVYASLYVAHPMRSRLVSQAR